MLSRVAVRRLATSTATAAKTATQAGKGPSRSDFYRMKFPTEAIPLVVIVSTACTAGIVKLGVDAMNPDTHFNPQERSTLDYLENDRSVEHAQRWTKQPYHTGPFSDPKGVLGIRPSV